MTHGSYESPQVNARLTVPDCTGPMPPDTVPHTFKGARPEPRPVPGRRAPWRLVEWRRAPRGGAHPRMIHRKLLIALAAAAIYAVVLVATADAALHRVRV